MAFRNFRILPPEVKIEVWRFALLAESQERVVLLHNRHVVPRRQLISPLLSTNKLSRDIALEFLTLSIPVADVPIAEVPFATRYMCRMSDQMQISIVFQEQVANLASYDRRGVLYLSPAHDTFITGLNFSPQFVRLQGAGAKFEAGGDEYDAYHEPTIIHNSNSNKKRKLRFRPITDRLDDQTCRRVENLVLAEQGVVGPEQRGAAAGPPWRRNYSRQRDVPWVSYRPAIADRLWQRPVFSGCSTFQHLWVAPAPGVLRGTLDEAAACAWTLARELGKNNAGGGGDRGSLNIRSWTAGEVKVEPRPFFSTKDTETRVYDVEEAERTVPPPPVLRLHWPRGRPGPGGLNLFWG
ncbi:hypothetical protein PG991_015275 [Apiospora marii]|uniref:2EXR domain-containing protein n=1 Tax=Apiospora marii TaxID=335849 RepID=A0ABR1R216_9PEZI